MTALDKAIAILEIDQPWLAHLASRLGHWVNGIKQSAKGRCLAIEQATGGKVKAEDLRPDINWEYVREQQKPLVIARGGIHFRINLRKVKWTNLLYQTLILWAMILIIQEQI